MEKAEYAANTRGAQGAQEKTEIKKDWKERRVKGRKVERAVGGKEWR
jgi:hypothetical protein